MNCENCKRLQEENEGLIGLLDMQSEIIEEMRQLNPEHWQAVRMKEMDEAIARLPPECRPK